MIKRRAAAVVEYADGPKVIASVATTGSMIIVSFGDGSDAHYTYPSDGRFHVTPHDPSSSRSFFEPGPAYDDLAYQPLAQIPVPPEPSQISRDYSPSRCEMLINPPLEEPGTLEVGVLGQQATPAVIAALSADGSQVDFRQGPRSDTTIVLRYLP